MEEIKFRRKISWFNFACCLLVIWIHAGNAELFMKTIGPEHSLIQMEYVVVPSLIRFSIPCFIIISAYLFYRGFTWDKLWDKWRRRARTLLLPYLLWNFLYYAGYLFASRIESLSDLVNKPGLALTLENLFEAVFCYAFNPVFWFMYQLICLVMLAPVLYLLLKNFWIGLGFLALQLLGLFLGKSLPQINLDALIYYSAGAFLALHAREAAEAAWTRRRFILGLGLWLFFSVVNYGIFQMQFVPAIVLYQLAASFGLWLMVDENKIGEIRPWMTCTFFIYAFHFIPVRFINKVCAALLPENEWAAVALFLAMPGIAVAVCYQAARILRRFLPGVWRALNGGR